jgi:hypothetical protein
MGQRRVWYGTQQAVKVVLKPAENRGRIVFSFSFLWLGSIVAGVFPVDGLPGHGTEAWACNEVNYTEKWV